MKIKSDLLPIGSVVKIKSYKNKVIIIERNTILDGKDFYDYGAALYPLGIYGKKILVFQSEDIEKIYCEGYQSQIDRNYQKKLQDEFKDVNFEKYAKKDWTWKKRILHFFHLL